MELGKRIRQLRAETGLSQLELAQRLGADGRQISRYENGHVSPSLEVLVRLSEVFDVSLDYLVFEKAPRRPRHLDDQHFSRRLEQARSLSYEDRAWLLEALDTLLARNEIKDLARSFD